MNRFVTGFPLDRSGRPKLSQMLLVIGVLVGLASGWMLKEWRPYAVDNYQRYVPATIEPCTF
jgi:hypothetical protein